MSHTHPYKVRKEHTLKLTNLNDLKGGECKG